MVQENDPLGILKTNTVPQEEQNDPLGILKKKEYALPTFGEQMAQRLDQPRDTSGDSGAPSKAAAPAPNLFDQGSFLKSLREKQKTKDESDKEARKQKLVEYYDNIALALDADPVKGPKTAYKNWNAETGTMDRYTYLEEKAQAEAIDNRNALATATGTIKQLQEDRRKAAAAGNMEEYSRLNDQIQQGVEFVRSHKAGATEDYDTPTGLQLWEESVGFTSELLNAKMDNLLANPQTQEKLNKLFAINQQLQKQETPELVEQYNQLLQDPDIMDVNQVSKQGQNLINSEKALAVKYPNIFQERIDKKAKQQGVDTMFKAMQGTPQGVGAAVMNQVGRSATGLLSDMAKLPALVDYDNKYGWQDKLDGTVDAITDFVNEGAFPIPTDFNQPLIYEDENGNSVFRTDLIIPKVSKVAGDMASLIFGASKISALGKASGLSNKVSSGIGLFSSSYVQSHDDYKKSGLAAGMSPEDAAWFATTAAATTSALELISPNKYLWSQASDELAKRVAKNITSGMSREQATKDALKFVSKEVFGENLQELSQMAGDMTIEKGSELLSGNDYFQHNTDDVINEALETMVLTTIIAGSPASLQAGSQIANRDSQYAEAIKLVAENKDKYLPLLQQAFIQTNAAPAAVQKVMDDIATTITPTDAAPLYVIGGKTVDRTAIEDAIRNGNLKDVYVANDKPLQQILEKAAKTTDKEALAELVKTPDVKVKEEPKQKTADGKVKEETPEDKAKKLAKAKIEALVQSGDLKYDGKRATVLTEHGGQQLSIIMNEMQRSQNDVVHETATSEKNEQPLKDVDQKAGKLIPAGKEAASQPKSAPETKAIEKELTKANKLKDEKGNVAPKQNSGYPSQLYTDLLEISGNEETAKTEYLKVLQEDGDFKKKHGDWENSIMKEFGRAGNEYAVKQGTPAKADRKQFAWVDTKDGKTEIVFNQAKVKREADFSKTKNEYAKEVISKEKGTPEQQKEYSDLYNQTVNKLRDLKLHLIHQALIKKQKGSVTIADNIRSLKEIQRINAIPLAKDYYGQPMVYMHSGKEGIGKFKKPGDPGYQKRDKLTGSAGIYFSRSPKFGRKYAEFKDEKPGDGKDVYYAFLKTRNPYYITDPRAQADYPLKDSKTITEKDVEALKKIGYDSIIWDHPTAGAKHEAVVFEPDQVEMIGSYREGLFPPAPAMESDISRFAKREMDPETKKIVDVLEKVKKSLSKVKPNLRVSLYNGTKEGKALLRELDPNAKLTGNEAGFYNTDNDVIGIDLSKADATTAFHEGFHPLVDLVKDIDPKLYEQLAEEAANEELEFEDGTTQKYIEYTKGNKKEALVEFLADFADGKFNELKNNKSIVKKVKDFINRILEVIGLKSADFDLDLNNIEDLQDFADQLATAISEGKTINVEKAAKKKKGTEFQNIGPKKKIRAYEKASGKKVNKTAKRIAYDKMTEHKEIQTDVIQNPQNYAYDPQKYKDIDTYLDSLSDIDLFNMISLDNSMSVLAGIKLLSRYNAHNRNPSNTQKKDTVAIFKKLREIGTSVGQLLRQFGELKSHTPQGIVEMVLGNLESLNVTLTKDQRTELEDLADKHIQALEDREAKRVAYVNNPNPQTKKALEDADDALGKTFLDLNNFISKVTPMGLDSMAATILQGNLLTSKSIVTNVIGNLVQQPLRQIELASGDIAVYMVNRFIRNVNTMNPFEMWFGATLNGITNSGRGIGIALKDTVTGRGAEYNASLEVRRNLKPWQALQQLTTKRSTLPVNAAGKVPKAVYIEKFLEGTAGWPAEAMFRMLYLGDKPFKEGAYWSGAYRLFAEQGGKRGTDEFRKFMANLTAKQKQQIQAYAEDATFSGKRTLATLADELVGTLNHWVDILAEKSPNQTFQYAAKAIGKTLLKANIPFVRVPSNLLQYLIELAMPPLTLYGSFRYAQQGDVRKSAQLFTRAMMGFSLYYLANMLYDAGIIIASGEDDEENERQLKHEVARPNSINMSALARLAAGGDPTFKEGDDIRDFTKMGLLGMFLAYNAEWNESIAKDQKKPRSEVSFTQQTVEALGSISQTSLEMSFLQGSFVALDAMRKGDFSNYISELGNTLSALAIPNQYAATFTRPRANYILRADDKKAINELFEKQSVKIFANLENNISGVYPIIGMFGDPVEQTPKGENSLMYHLFDITNNEHIQDPLALEVFNLAKKTGEVPIGTPSASISIEGKQYTMPEQDYLYLQMLAGRYKRLALGSVVNEPDWKTTPDDEKLLIMKSINESANSDMREFMLGTIYDGIEAGRIKLDKEMGTYSYTSPSEFDFDFAKKNLVD